ncbi:MAG: HEAT repeat domain-containing protein [Candidatus Hydrogenedentes bacterium]|nr:HEAT repeat domain-containing protein [Candidatus Hydrogenedentota bacterium]
MCPLVKKDSSLGEIYSALESASPEVQIQAIEVFASAGRKDALKYILNALDSDNPNVRKAGIRAIGSLGGKDEVRLLLSLAVREGEEAEIARESLAELKGADVGETMLQELRKEQISPEAKRLLIPLVSMRKVPGSEEVILRFASDADTECRVSALKSLVDNPNAEIFESVLGLVRGASDEQEKKLIEELLVKILELKRDEGEKYVSHLSNLIDSDLALEAKALLLRVLARSGLPAGWDKIKSLIIPQQSAELLNAVFVSLKDWPGEEPVQFLVEFAQSNPELPNKDSLLDTILVLSDKWSSDGEVLKQRISNVLALNPSVKTKRMALEKLASRKIEHTLPLLLEHLRTGEDEVKDALIRTLSGWQSRTIVDAFAELAQSTQNNSIKRQALGGMIKVADSLPEATIEERNQIFNRAVSLADSSDVLKGVIGGLQNASYPEALKLVAKFLDNSEVRNEAEVATVKLAKTLVGVCPNLVKESLEKVKAQTELPMLKDEAEKILSAMGKFEDFITGWLLSGPYTNDEINPNMLYEFAFSPEKPEEVGKVVWKPVSSGTNPNRPMVVELHKVLGGENRVAYLKTYIWSDEEQDAKLLLGSDDGVRVWLNGERVFGRNVNRGCNPDDDTIDVHLRKGWNELLAKIRQGSGEWAFCARVRKSDGSPFEPQLKFSITPQ